MKGLDNTRKLEEEERQRRMTEKITPEQRNKLRIFSHEVVDQVVNKQRGKFVKPATFKVIIRNEKIPAFFVFFEKSFRMNTYIIFPAKIIFKTK